MISYVVYSQSQPRERKPGASRLLEQLRLQQRERGLPVSFWTMLMLLMAGVIIYVGRRGHQAFSGTVKPAYMWIYWAVYLLFAFSFIVLERMETGLGELHRPMAWLGGYSVAFLYYAFFILVLIDLVRLADKWWGFVPHRVKHAPAKIAVAVIALLIGLLGYGTWNALHPVYKAYDITVAKNAGANSELHAVLVSDLHLGAIVNNSRLDALVTKINQRHPDIVFLAGDVIDGSIEPFVQENMAVTLKRLKPGLGVYAVPGNHDGHNQEVVPYLEAAGVKVLNDRYCLINNSFYVAGRSNRGHGMESGGRPDLRAVLSGADQRLPVILLDHNPSDLAEAEAGGVDLQLSGHTHQGQMFPNNYVTGNMYDIDWGYLRKGNLQVIVSSGFGTWGPPIRIGTTPEIVDLRVHFAGR